MKSYEVEVGLMVHAEDEAMAREFLERVLVALRQLATQASCEGSSGPHLAGAAGMSVGVMFAGKASGHDPGAPRVEHHGAS